jgi:hypothetical protein
MSKNFSMIAAHLQEVETKLDKNKVSGNTIDASVSSARLTKPADFTEIRKWCEPN